MADVAVNISLESKHCAYHGSLVTIIVEFRASLTEVEKSSNMYFWKIVRNLIEQWLPDWRDKFLSYKLLKKQLKIAYPTYDPDQSSVAAAATIEMIDFNKLLDCEIDKLNLFFMEKEKEYLQRWTNLPDKIAEARESKDRFELMKICQEVLDFHGEMVLLENYSAINYIGLVKFVKKYDKRSGNTILLPFIQNLQKQPFFSTDVLNTLVHNCERTLNELLFLNVDEWVCDRDEDEDDEMVGMDGRENRFFKLVQLALQVLKEIRSGSKTKSAFSLPPMQD